MSNARGILILILVIAPKPFESFEHECQACVMWSASLSMCSCFAVSLVHEAHCSVRPSKTDATPKPKSEAGTKEAETIVPLEL